MPADLVLIAIGFTGVERGLVDQLDVALGERGAIEADDFATSTNGVFACGDARRGQSLIVWAIAEGRQCAAAVERYLTAAAELSATTSARALQARRGARSPTSAPQRASRHGFPSRDRRSVRERPPCPTARWPGASAT